MVKEEISLRLWTVIIVVAALALSACASRASPTPTPALALTDQMGRTVELGKPPQRIISLSPANTEIAFALGLGDRLVGLDSYSDFPPEAEKIEKVGGFQDPDLEKVVALKPDLILADDIHKTAVLPELERRGFKVLGLDPKDLDGVLEAIALVGKATGQEQEAATLVQGLRQRIDAVDSQVAEVQSRPRAIYITWPDPIWTGGQGTFAHDLIEKAGGSNIAADLQGWATINLESLVARDPQVIIAEAGHEGGASASFDFASQEPRLKDVAARREGRVYAVDANIVNRPGPRLVDALEEFAYFLHPECFK